MEKYKPAKSVDLVLSKPLTPTVYRNTYKLVINNMHGDADGTTYTEEYFDRKREPLLEDILLLLHDSALWLINRDQTSDRLNEICKKHIKLIDPDEEEYYEDYASELIDYDYRYEGCMCRPTLESLTYFNEDGKEFNVNVHYKYV